MLSKAKQLFKNKELKITKEDRKYLLWLQLHKDSIGCYVCGTRFFLEFHHVKLKSTDKKNHKRLIGLCSTHHTGNEISPHGTPKLWRETYAMEEQNKTADNLYQRYLDEKGK